MPIGQSVVRFGKGHKVSAGAANRWESEMSPRKSGYSGLNVHKLEGIVLMRDVLNAYGTGPEHDSE